MKLPQNEMFSGYPIVPEYKYLGIWIDDKLTFEK